MQREIKYVTSMCPLVEYVHTKFRDCQLRSSEVEMGARTHTRRTAWSSNQPVFRRMCMLAERLFNITL
jgi:4-hydroxy-3-methylbut-2-enyl diphosphate reductase IspH